jgi:hypothetical protein
MRLAASDLVVDAATFAGAFPLFIPLIFLV